MFYACCIPSHCEMTAHIVTRLDTKSSKICFFLRLPRVLRANYAEIDRTKLLTRDYSYKHNVEKVLLKAKVIIYIKLLL